MWPAGPGEAAEQMMSREYAEQGSRVMFPNAGRDYGYTLPLSYVPFRPGWSNRFQ